MPVTKKRQGFWFALLFVLLVAAWCLTGNPGVQSNAVFGRWRDRWLLVHLGVLWLWGIAWLRWGVRMAPKGWKRLLALHIGALLVALPAELAAWADQVDFRIMGARRHHRMGITYAQPIEAGGMRWYGTPGLRLEGRVLPDLARHLGVDAEPVPYRFETDRHGLRNILTGKEQSPRILCLGDSLLVGGLVPIEATLPARLTVETGALCMCIAEVAYGPQEEVLRLESTGIPVRDKLVLQFVFEGNDLKDSILWREWVATGRKMPWPESGFCKNLLALAHRPVRAKERVSGGLYTHTDGTRTEVFFKYRGARIDEFLGELPVVVEVFRNLDARVREERGAYALVLVPHKLRVLEGLVEFPPHHQLAGGGKGPSGLSPALAAFCAAEGIPYLDLTEALRAEAIAGHLPFFPKDTHLNEVGLATCARAVGAWVRSASLLPGRGTEADPEPLRR